MAGDWLKIQHATPDKPEIVRMAGILNIDHNAVVGACLRLWIWADQQTVDGNGLSVTIKFIDRLTHCPDLGQAMVEVGWLTGTDGNLTLPNYDRHNGRTAKTRAQTAARVKKARDSCNALTVTNVTPVLLSSKGSAIDPEKGSTTAQVGPETGSTTAQVDKEGEVAMFDINGRAVTEKEIHTVYWQYPRHVKKPKSIELIAKALKVVGYDELLQAVTEYADIHAESEHKFLPHLPTWLRNERWMDDRNEWRNETKDGKPESGTAATVAALRRFGEQQALIENLPGAPGNPGLRDEMQTIQR